jgi:hypothetical protein
LPKLIKMVNNILNGPGTRRDEFEMSNSGDNVISHPRVRNLRDAVHKIRSAEADRSDSIADLRETERARLGLLADELADVFREVPKDDDQFLFQTATGLSPRLWIDMTSHVAIGRDRRTYRFLKDSRLGRTVIVETADLDQIADRITDYIAERLIEREKAIEGEWVSNRPDVRKATPSAPADELAVRMPYIVPRLAASGWVAFAFLLGLMMGIGALFAYVWVSFPA